jgi:hypothetical protein
LGRRVFKVVSVIDAIGVDGVEGQALLDEIANGGGMGPETGLAGTARIAGKRS